MATKSEWIVAEMDHFYGRFPNKRLALRTLRALRLDGRARPKMKRLRPHLYEYTPPSTSSRQSKVYIGSERQMRREGFGELLDEAENRPDYQVGGENDCEHCGGTGNAQDECTGCGVALTGSNVARALGYDVSMLDQCLDCYVAEHPHGEE